jgi:hypothetical protein
MDHSLSQLVFSFSSIALSLLQFDTFIISIIFLMHEVMIVLLEYNLKVCFRCLSHRDNPGPCFGSSILAQVSCRSLEGAELITSAINLLGLF